MKFYTSYFYTIRFFMPNMIPVSTAIWDPKWYHAFLGQGHAFIDKHGVMNGIRCSDLSPAGVHTTCGKDCPYTPDNCQFLKDYRKKLDKIDYKQFIQQTNELVDEVQTILKFEDDPIIVFMVHESPINQCSERKVIQEWFASHDKYVRELKLLTWK